MTRSSKDIPELLNSRSVVVDRLLTGDDVAHRHQRSGGDHCLADRDDQVAALAQRDNGVLHDELRAPYQGGVQLTRVGRVGPDGHHTGIIWHQASIEQGGSRAGGRHDQLGIVHVLGGDDSRIQSTGLHAGCECACPVLVPGDNRDRPVGRMVRIAATCPHACGPDPNTTRWSTSAGAR
jgi:hypothetical protein